jgi:hypothetical protein
MDRCGSVSWIMVTCTETIVNAPGSTILTYVCSYTIVPVRRYTIVLSYFIYTDLKKHERPTDDREYPVLRRNVNI